MNEYELKSPFYFVTCPTTDRLEKIVAGLVSSQLEEIEAVLLLNLETNFLTFYTKEICQQKYEYIRKVNLEEFNTILKKLKDLYILLTPNETPKNPFNLQPSDVTKWATVEIEGDMSEIETIGLVDGTIYYRAKNRWGETKIFTNLEDSKRYLNQ